MTLRPRFLQQWLLSLLLTIVAMGASSLPLHAQEAPSQSGGAPQLLATVKVPGVAGRWDVMAIDPSAKRLYVSDTSNEALDVMDTTTQSFVAQIKGLPSHVDAKGNWSGSNGLAVAPELNKVWVSDQVDSAVHIYDTTSLTQTAVVPTTQKGSDSVVYDPADKKVYVSNGDSKTITVLDATSNKILTQIALPGSPELAAWDPFDGTIHQNLSDMNGQVVINPKTDQIMYGFPMSPGCEPHGLSFAPKNQYELVGCTKQLTLVIDGGTGNLVSGTNKIGGGDITGYNPVNNRFYVAASGQPGGPIVGVFDGTTGDYVGSAKTDKGAHLLAVDPSDGKVYVGAGAAGTILIFAP